MVEVNSHACVCPLILNSAKDVVMACHCCDIVIVVMLLNCCCHCRDGFIVVNCCDVVDLTTTES